MLLILLELGMLIVCLILFVVVNLSLRVEVVFLFSTFMVSGASLRIALLVRLARSHGNDYLMLF